METKKELETALKDAMRAGDATRKNAIRMALSNIKMAEIDKGGPIDEPAMLALIQKEIKMRQEAIEDAKKGNRADLLEKAQAEIVVLEGFLPKQLSLSELQELIQSVINETGAASPTDMGKVMKAVMTKVQGRAPGDQVSRVVKETLQNQA